MESLMGFVLGVLIVPVYRALRDRTAKEGGRGKAPPLTREQQQAIQEYRNFFHYDGDEQEVYHGD